MNRLPRAANGAMVALISLVALPTIPAHADGWSWSNGGHSHNSRSDDANRQDSKNNWRNLAIGSGAAAVVGLLTHNKGLAVIGAAGAAISASQYESDRQRQSRDDGWGDRRRYHRDDNRNYGYQPSYDYRDGNYSHR